MEDTIKKTEENIGTDQILKGRESDLKAARELKGLTLKDIFESTRISVVNLEAIEKGDFHMLPSPVFTKAFIKTYTKTLGIDSSNILTRYEQYLDSLKAPSQKAEAKEISKTATRRYRFLLWSLAVITGTGIIVFSIASYKSDVDIPKTQIGQPVNPTNEAKPAEGSGMPTGAKSESSALMNPVAKSEDPALQSAATSQTAPLNQESTGRSDIQQGAAIQEMTKQPQAAGETYRLTMEAKELTWIRIKADQDPSQDILLKPGDRIERLASGFVIVIGNAGGINIDFQGKSLGDLGRRGQVVHLKLP